jgi:pimeloyl-ACP methyl ester carboxylesterase
LSGAERLEPEGFDLAAEWRLIAGERLGTGHPVVLLHGLSATRRYVVHGSKALARSGYRQVTYDARGHGHSEPAPEGGGYTYPELVTDLKLVVGEEAGDSRFVLGGHSMGAHTAVSYALDHADRLAGLVLVGPVYMRSTQDEDLERWDRLADGLERGGVDGFMEAFDRGLDPAWRERVLAFTRRRMLEHEHPEAVARALREVPQSAPFESLAELEFLDVPTLVVGSNDVADPGHPHAVAVAYADAIPDAILISEEEGASPLAWQGGRLSREIAEFSGSPAVAERLA